MGFLTRLSLKRPVSVCLAVLALLVFGVGSLIGTPMELMPDINMPMLVVMGIYPGASPEDVESLVTVHLESAASTLTGVKDMSCISSENMSMVLLEFEYGTNMEDVKADLRGNLEIYRNYLPDEVNNPTIVEMRSDMQPTIVLSATQKGDVDLYSYVKENVVPEIKQVNGVANVEIMGGDRKYVSITLKEEKMMQYGLNMDTVAQIIKNADFSIPAGTISQGNVDLLLRGGVEYKTINSLNSIPLTLKTGDIIHLSDISDIGFAVPEKASISKTNGVDDVMISVSKRQSTSTFDVTDGVKKVIDKANAKDQGVELTILDDASAMIKSSVSSVFQTMLWGIVLAMAVLFLFFGDWKASVIVGTSIPLSLLVTIIAMQAAGFSFNILSLGGLVIGIGMMVDNSIVVLESCFRTAKGAKSIKEAVIDGTKVVSASILASTLTTVVVFLPIAFIKGMSGQLFGQLCFTIVFSLLASYLSAISIVPLVYYKIMPTEKEHPAVRRALLRLEEGYMKILPKTLRHKRKVLAVAALLLIGSFMLLPFIGVELIPATDEGTVAINVDTRAGLSASAVEKIMEPIVNTVKDHPDVEKYSVTIGSQGIMSIMMGSSSSATVTAYLKKDRDLSTNEFVDFMRKQTKDMVDCKAVVAASNTTSMMTGGSTVDVPLKGNDYDDLVKASYMVEEYMNGHPDIINVSSTVSSGNPQAEIKIDPVKAGAHGLVPAAAMASVRNMTEGTEATTMNQNGTDYSVKVCYPKERFKSISDLDSLMLTNAVGMNVPLSDIADISYSNSPQSITKENGQYIITIQGQPSLDASTKLGGRILDKVSQMDLPVGVNVSQSVQIESMYEEFTALLYAIFTAVFLVFLVMAMQFESPRFSIVVMMCVPFSLIGSFTALFLSGTSISMPSLMGFLMLVGTVVNNGILFIDTASNLREEEGFTLEAALAKAGSIRLRPILMTTLTTVLAMVPLAIGIGENGALMKGMAMVIIGGLIASTILAMLVLPSFYMIVDKKDRKMRREKRKAKKVAKQK